MKLDIAFPIHMLMDDAMRPFTIANPGDPETFWPLFNQKENAAAFATGMGRQDLGIAAFISSTNLLKMMEGVRPDAVTTIWMHEVILDTRRMQFRDRLTVGEFFAALKELADQERDAHLN